MAPISVGLVLLLCIQSLSSSAIDPPADPVPQLAQAYKTFYACVIQCYRDSFRVSCTGDDPCIEKPHIGPFKKQRFPFKQIEDSFYCITKGCNSQVPTYLCGVTPMDNPSDQSGANGGGYEHYGMVEATRNNMHSSFITLIKRLMLKSNFPTYPAIANVGSAATTDCDSTETETTTTGTTTDCYSTETETTPTDTTTDCYSTETETTPTDTTTDCDSTETETTTTDITADCDDDTESPVASTYHKNKEGIVNYAPVSSSSWSSAQSNTGSISNGNPGYSNLRTSEVNNNYYNHGYNNLRIPEVNKNYNWNSQSNILRSYGDNTNYLMPHSSLAGNGNPNSWLPTTHNLNGWFSAAQQPLSPDQTKVLYYNNMYNKIPYNSNGVMSNRQNIDVTNTRNQQILPQKNVENNQQIFWPQYQLSYAHHPNIYPYHAGPIPVSSQIYHQNPFYQSTPFVSVSRDVTNNGQQSSVAISNAASGSNAFDGGKSESNTQTWLQPQMQNQNAYSRENSGINRYSWVPTGQFYPQQFLTRKTQQNETRGVTNNGQSSSVAHGAAISDSVPGNAFYGGKSGDNTQPRLQPQVQNQNGYSGDNFGINRYSWMQKGSSNPQQYLMNKSPQVETRYVTNNGQPSSVAQNAAISNSGFGKVFYGDKSGGNTQVKLPQQIQNQKEYFGDNSGNNGYSFIHGGPSDPQHVFISKTQQDETVAHKNENVP